MKVRVSQMSISEAVRYGFSMTVYFFVTGAMSLLFVAIGMDLMSQTDSGALFFGFAMFAIGFLFYFSAIYGAIYKLISDSVMRGTIEAADILNQNKSPPTPPAKKAIPAPPPRFENGKNLREKKWEEKMDEMSRSLRIQNYENVEKQAQAKREKSDLEQWQNKLLNNSEDPE